MCGICGIVDFSGPPVSADLVQTMADAIRHRGPDDSGILAEGPFGFGHRRLSVVDLSAAGHQPMESASGRSVLTYNGENYNYLDLSKDLVRAGARFRGHCDAEVVLEALDRWGDTALERIHGMFAIAVWNREDRSLLLARDRFGIKPLYYAVRGKRLVFGSEIKAILAAGDDGRRIDRQALAEYLWYGNALGENTLFAGIRKLRPGHRLRFDETGCVTEPFWELRNVPSLKIGKAEAVERVREHLECAVKRHLMGDVPIGIFLSGGIDSSAVAALAARNYGERIKTYSVGFDFNSGESELPQARLVAEKIGSDHNELHVGQWDAVELVERLVAVHDEPFGDAANIPLYLLCDQLGGSPKVVLQGDGGDEMFAGYRRYKILARGAWPVWVSRLARAPASLVRSGGRAQRIARFVTALGHPDPALRMALLLTTETLEEDPARALGGSLRDDLGRYDPFAEYRRAEKRFRHLDAVQKMLFTDASILLPNTFLEKVDKSTMAHGIEVRLPFLDDVLAPFAAGLPADLKVREGRTKWVLARALRGIVPDSVLDAPKRGFGVPYGDWLGGALADRLREVVFDSSVDGILFDRDALGRLIDDHISGRRDHSFPLWKCLNLGLWYQTHAATL